MTTIPLAEARAQLSRLVDQAVRTHERVEVTRKGRRAVVLMSAEDYDSIMETLEILGDADEVRAIATAQAQ
ncbi:MAG: type II toxin-antitoxin system Phd/YefM family antitoxin, partial [Actinomycetes bacterium]